MNLKDVFDALNAGELRNNYLADDEGGTADRDNKSKLLSLIKRGLTELHTRFDLRIRQVEILFVPAQYSYTLDSTIAPGLLKIERILVQDEEGYLQVQPYNQKQNIFSYQSPNFKTVSLPVSQNIAHTSMVVEYREDHPALSEDVMFESPEDIEIELPQPYLEPLVLYVSAKVMSSHGATDGIDSSTNLNAQYEMACAKLEGFNMDNDQLEWRDAIYEDGWV